MAGQDFKTLAADLEQALDDVKATKTAKDEAAAELQDATNAYSNAVTVAQKAKAAYDAHINEAMTGFAQVHQ